MVLKKKSARLRRIYKRLLLFIAFLIIIAALISSFVRALTPFASQYKRQVELQLSHVLGLPVHIARMETGWYWFYPVVELKEVKISKDAKPLIHLDKILVGLNILDSLLHWQIQPGLLYIEGLNLTVQQKGTSFEVEGLVPTHKTSFQFDAQFIEPIFAWVFDQEKIILKDLTIKLILEDGTLLPINKLNLSINEQLGHYYVDGKAAIGPQSASSIHLLADFKIRANHWQKLGGKAYLAVHHFDIKPWLRLLPQIPLEAIEGIGDMETWLDMQAGTVQKAQAIVDLKNIAVVDSHHRAWPQMQLFKANMAWLRTQTGWELRADPIKAALSGTLWLKNSFLLRYIQTESQYQLYLKHLPLDPSLLQLSQGFIHELMPSGNLSDVQVYFNDNGEVQYLLSSFSNLSWHVYKRLPAFEHLSGALYWQPHEGRLELDTEQARLHAEGLPLIPIETLNGALEWKDVGNGLKFNLERFALKIPELLLTARGSLDNWGEDTAQIDAALEVSADNAQKWLQYLPSTPYLKPKFVHWLKNDIKQVDNIVLEMSVHGAVNDFPFDTKPGVFLIKSYIKGVRLDFAPKWPTVHDLDLWLTIDKRELTGDIAHVGLLNIEANRANFVVSPLGSNKETLRLHGQSKVLAKDLIHYALATPLLPKLSALKLIHMKGNLDVDLQIEAPLYPEDDQILGQGNITFADNDVFIRHALHDLTFQKLNGTMQVSEKGIQETNLSAELLAHPVSINIQTVEKPVAATVVKVAGNTTVDTLSSILNMPLQKVLSGNLVLESAFSITDDPNDLDHVSFQTNLQGLRINLPRPFAKTESMFMPLAIDLGYNVQKGLELKAELADILQAYLWFSGRKGQFHFERGDVFLGAKKGIVKPQKGFQILGTLDSFDVTLWQKAWDLLPKSDTNIFDTALNLIDIQVKNIQAFGQEYKDLSLVASKASLLDWRIQLNQKNLLAELNYDVKARVLKGIIKRLVLEKNAQFAPSFAENSAPGSWPSIQLSIQDLRYNQLRLGTASIKTHVDAVSMKLEDASLQTPYYKLAMTGEWIAEGGKNETSVNALMTLSNLSKALALWSVSPVVEASQGTIQIIGGWPGGFHNFSLKHCAGQLAVVLKNGRISQFSPETEEKLGLGKLLSILSLQTIPRRLQLDFSDLSQNGYSFDIFKGNFSVNKGIMSTKNAYIDGPIAYASMKGSLDIVKQLYDLDLRVSPHIEASLPIVATIAGGPIAGIATWVIGKIIHQGMQKVAGYTYKVSGPWKAPLVQQVIIVKHKQ